MLDKLFGYRVHATIHHICFIALCIGLPLNKVVMSLATMLCGLNILLEGKFKTYFQQIKGNKIVLLLLSLFLLHLLGLLYTSNYEYALHDLRVKLPLLVIPFVFGAKPIERNILNSGLKTFLFVLTITSIINYLNYSFKSAEGIILDIREMSLFASHIRYALLIVFGVGISLIFTVQRKKYFLIYALLFAWFSWYALYSQVLSGVIAYAFLVGGLFIHALLHLKIKWMKWTLICVFGLTTFGIAYYLVDYLSPEVENYIYGELETHSKKGNKYYHDTTSTQFENGNPLMIYLAEDEMRKAWNTRSAIPYDSLDRKQQNVKYTLWRYLTSLNHRKDAEGVMNLSDHDVSLIEQGIPTSTYESGGLHQRLDGMKVQLGTYLANGNPNGHSLLQRFEHWSAAKYIIVNNPVIGVGTGDVQDEFNKAYIALDSQLEIHHRNRAHNQFLTFWISFGVIGIALFICLWIVYFKLALQREMLIPLAFGLVAFASFLPEDTIETQHGVTFIALFTTVFSSLFYQKAKS